MPRFCLINFGCRASQADGFALKRQLLDRGLEETAEPEDSDFALLNTCTVTAAADAEVRQVIRRIHRGNADCAILVTGCYAQRAADEIAQLPGVRWVVGNSHKHLIPDLAGQSFRDSAELRDPVSAPAAASPELFRIGPAGISGNRPDGETAIETAIRDAKPQILVGQISDEFHFLPVFADDRTRPTLKIQDGCNARCSFCVIPFVRGQSRSMDPEAIIAQVRELEKSGYQEIVLSGINLGSYGRDLGGGMPFLGLLKRILDHTSIARLRISSIEPMDVSRELIELVADEPRIARHFHIPLQSGCDRILRLMNRRYWTSQYRERLLAIRERIPEAGIGADVMAGFPGETDQDHEESLRFMESMPLTYVHVFPYSARPGTRAVTMANPPDGRRVHERCGEIRSLIAQKHLAFLEDQIGRTLSVLTLHDSIRDMRLAISSNYLKVALPGAGLAENVILDATPGCAEGGVLYCQPAA